MRFLGYGFCTVPVFTLFLFLCTARSQATSWLIDKGGFDVLVEGKEDVVVKPPVSSPELSEFMMNHSERRFFPLLLALAKVV